VVKDGVHFYTPNTLFSKKNSNNEDDNFNAGADQNSRQQEANSFQKPSRPDKKFKKTSDEGSRSLNKTPKDFYREF
jgi:hypothetical protein